MSKPTRRVSRRRHWKRRYDTEKTPAGRLAVAYEYLRAMRAAGDRTIPRATRQLIDQTAQAIFDKADMLARQIPATELEEEDNPKWNSRQTPSRTATR
jgi:hypothetical protein